jgi:cell division septation protein DedD
MDPRSNSNSGLGLPQPGNDMGQLPSIHTPQSFHAPDTAATHFDAATPQIGAAVPVAQPMPIAADPAAMSPTPAAAAGKPASVPTPQPTSHTMEDEHGSQFSVAPVEDTDTDFDEEWVAKAREVVARTYNDPYLQSQELGKLKAQYIKLRYNKDIKVD